MSSFFVEFLEKVIKDDIKIQIINHLEKEYVGLSGEKSTIQCRIRAIIFQFLREDTTFHSQVSQ